jgi:hypothetical protein
MNSTRYVQILVTIDTEEERVTVRRLRAVNYVNGEVLAENASLSDVIRVLKESQLPPAEEGAPR